MIYYTGFYYKIYALGWIKLMKDKQILEKNTMKRVFAMECALTHANRQTERANSNVSKLEQKILAMKQKLEYAFITSYQS